MSHVFGRNARSDFPVAVRGEGLYLYDADGNRYLDASGGAAVSCLGHGHPAVREAIKRQVDLLAYAHTGYFTNEPQERLADELIAHAPAGLTRAFFVTGGSEATEAAMKLARQFHVESGTPAFHLTRVQLSRQHVGRTVSERTPRAA
jgi:adenosylmethionine-8-amino-7-oxononanoate aminotransferase